MPKEFTTKDYIEQGFKNLESKIDELSSHVQEVKSEMKKINGRTRSLESSRVQIWTAIAITLFLGSTIVALASQVIDDKIDNKVEEAVRRI